ncbi:hypothetical protein HHI36_009221 [Cryptolaemus montrouzieri]|uniref:Uncharacterized protein n=1 Tax=Cryptolaemus montrouzieri TaxID=559131 RepID=A0ABD2MUU8_9CUCU
MPPPPYSPDLAPSDYYLFPKLKTWLGGERFAGSEEEIEAENGCFEKLDESAYSDGITRLKHRHEKRISLYGDSVEKYKKFLKNIVFLGQAGNLSICPCMSLFM